MTFKNVSLITLVLLILVFLSNFGLKIFEGKFFKPKKFQYNITTNKAGVVSEKITNFIRKALILLKFCILLKSLYFMVLSI